MADRRSNFQIAHEIRMILRSKGRKDAQAALDALPPKKRAKMPADILEKREPREPWQASPAYQATMERLRANREKLVASRQAKKDG